jgi:tRNA 2-selenouridine synthase
MINDKFLTLSKDTRILVYCWRGGLRSKSLSVILNQCGFNNLKLLKGGYKNFRNLVTSSLNEMIQSHQYMVLAGNTGSGKDIFRSSFGFYL